MAIDCSRSPTRSCSCCLPCTRSLAFEAKPWPTCSGDKVPDDIRAALRKERFMLRGELRRLVPDLAADPLPGNQTHGENVVCLDTSLVSSDVHEFTELLNYAEKEKLEPAAAIEVYEAALGLYRGDLLDSTHVFSYRWMYNEDPQIALMLRSDLRRRHKETRLRLAELLAQGPRRRRWPGRRSCTQACVPRIPKTSACGPRCFGFTNGRGASSG